MNDLSFVCYLTKIYFRQVCWSVAFVCLYVCLFVCMFVCLFVRPLQVRIFPFLSCFTYHITGLAPCWKAIVFGEKNPKGQSSRSLFHGFNILDYNSRSNNDRDMRPMSFDRKTKFIQATVQKFST